MKMRKLFFFVAALFISANVMTAQANCRRELMEDVAAVHLVYNNMPAGHNSQWDLTTGVFSGHFTANAGGAYGGQHRFNIVNNNIDNIVTPVVFSPGAEAVTISLRVEISWEGEGTMPAGGGYSQFVMHLYDGAARVLASPRTAALRNGVHYLVFENISIPAGAAQFTQIRLILGWGRINTTFHISEISICEVIPPVFVCDPEGTNLFTGPITLTQAYYHDAGGVGNICGNTAINAAGAACMLAEGFINTDNNVITGNLPHPTPGRWQTQLLFDFPNVAINPANQYRIAMTVETDAHLPAYIRIYTSGANPNLTFIRDGAVSMSSGIYEIVIAESFRPSVAGNITGMRWGIGGHAAGINFTFSNIIICRVIEVPPADAPQLSANPASLTFTPDAGVQTFQLTGQNLTGDVHLTAPAGFTVSPTTITPNPGTIDETITVTWTSGGTNVPVVISGGGVATPIEVTLNAGLGFSSHCNAVVTGALGGVPGVANNKIMSKIWDEENANQIRLYIKPYADGHTPLWNYNAFWNAQWYLNGVHRPGTTRYPLQNAPNDAGNVLTITFPVDLAAGDVLEFRNGQQRSWVNAGAGGGLRHFGAADWVTFTVGGCDLADDGTTWGPEISVSSVILFPNPVTDILFFTEEVRAVNIFTVLGQRVLSEVNVSQVRVSHLPSGLYIVNAVDADGNQVSAIIEVR